MNEAKRQAPLRARRCALVAALVLLWCLPMERAPNAAALPNKEPRALCRCMQLLLLAAIARWRAPRGFARWHASRGARLTALLCLFVPEALAQQCASAPTCPALGQSGLASDTCSMKQYGQTWGLSTMYAGTKLSGKQSRDGGFPIAMPGKGLYKILKVSKDESNCCYDLEVQGFMCEVMRNKTAVRALTPCCCCCAR